MTSDRPAAPLLAVKQVVPPVRAGAVPRHRLVRTLQEASTRLTVVVAPAGWGKTSLLGAWASDPDGPERLAWVSLDEGDDEPTRFWRYVLSALGRASDDIGPGAGEALAASGVAAVDLALPLLLNDLAASSTRHVLVLDDYHVLTDARIHEAVEFLVSYLPPSLRLVLAGRADPPLPLARMRARGQLTELRAADLRFSVDEAAALIATVSGTDLDDATSSAVWERTEGWAAGLQLAGLALRGAPRHAPHVRGDDRHLLDYFGAEVLPALAPDQRDLLVRAAPLERLSGPLCDAALQVTGSAGILDALDRADLFVVPLDAGHEWYRCHHLLRDVLLREAATRPDTREVLHRAASWFEEQGRVDDAVSHLLRADDTRAAAELLQSGEHWFFTRGAAATYLVLGEQLPASDVEPHLAVTMAYAAATSGRLDRVPHWLDRCEERITPDTVVRGWRSPRAAAVMMRAVIGTPDTETGRAVELCRHAVALEGEAGGEDHPVARVALGSALARDGRFEEAAALLRGSWRGREGVEWSPGVPLQVAGNLGMSLLELGRDDELDVFLREAGRLADDAEARWGGAAGPVVALLRVVAGRHRYRRGDVAGSRQLLRRAVALAQASRLPTTTVLGLVHLADAEVGCGDRAAARAALDRAREAVDEEPVTPFVMGRLDEAQTRVGRSAARAANRSGVLAEELTDRELSILRLLPGPASQREIGAAMHLSVNTVKAYNKSLYRKLDVSSRQDAVALARRLGLI